MFRENLADNGFGTHRDTAYLGNHMRISVRERRIVRPTCTTWALQRGCGSVDAVPAPAVSVITQSPPARNTSNGYLIQPGVFLFDRESGSFNTREQETANPNILTLGIPPSSSGGGCQSGG